MVERDDSPEEYRCSCIVMKEEAELAQSEKDVDVVRISGEKLLVDRHRFVITAGTHTGKGCGQRVSRGGGRRIGQRLGRRIEFHGLPQGGMKDICPGACKR